MKMTRSVVKCLIWAATLAVASRAEAYSYDACNGSAVKWEGNHLLTQRNSCSILTGSEADYDYWNSGQQWRAANITMDYNWVRPANDCTVTYNDGVNEVATVSPATIGYAYGLTHIVTDSTCFWWFSSEHIVEADVLLANNLRWGNPDESQYDYDNGDGTFNVSGRETLVHEFGHALGLNHFQAFNMMKPHPGLPYVGGTGSHLEPFPDEIAGVNVLYPSNAVSQTNLAASAQKWDGSEAQKTDPNITRYACPGGTVYVTVTIVNNGTTSGGTWPLRAYIRNSPASSDGYGGGYTIWSGSAWTTPGYYTTTLTTTIPTWTIPGLYWVYWRVDNGNQVVESNEADNDAQSAMVIQVLSC